MKNFITAKLCANDTNAFPHSMFKWRSHSGDDVTAYFTRVSYQGEYDVGRVFECRNGNRQSSIADISFGMFGYGDGGSGSTTDMLERAEALKNIPGVPETVNSSAHEFFDEIGKKPTNSRSTTASSILKITEEHLQVRRSSRKTTGAASLHSETRRYCHPPPSSWEKAIMTAQSLKDCGKYCL